MQAAWMQKRKYGWFRCDIKHYLSSSVQSHLAQSHLTHIDYPVTTDSATYAHEGFHTLQPQQYIFIFSFSFLLFFLWFHSLASKYFSGFDLHTMLPPEMPTTKLLRFAMPRFDRVPSP